MKTRTGLVSNSSSSSFCVIGISRWRVGPEKMNEICEKLKLDSGNESHGYIESDELVDPFEAWGTREDEIYFIGINARWALKEAQMPFKSVVDMFVETMKDEYKIKISRKDVDLFYGECGSG